MRRQSPSIRASTFTNVLALHFKVKFDQLFVHYTVTIDFKLADIKLESSEAYLPKLEKICHRVLKLLTFFAKTRF